MLCTNCKKKEADIYYKKTVNGKTVEYSLCSECAEKLRASGEIDSSVFGHGHSAFDPFHSLIDQVYGSLFSPMSGISAQGSTRKKCDKCGSTYAELSKEGKVGCAHCYQVFADELASGIYSIHGKASYTGRAPKGQREKLERKNEIAKLKAQLKEAIESERYEDAAALRDSIRQLEAGESGGNA